MGEKLLRNEPFKPSENDYDWLGSGVYFWELNPDRALEWANRQTGKVADFPPIEPIVVGAIIDLGLCLDLVASSGLQAVERAYLGYPDLLSASDLSLPENSGGTDHPLRKLACAVINYLHAYRFESAERPGRGGSS